MTILISMYLLLAAYILWETYGWFSDNGKNSVTVEDILICLFLAFIPVFHIFMFIDSIDKNRYVKKFLDKVIVKAK